MMKNIKIGFILCIFCVTSVNAQHSSAPDKPAVHGMVIFGQEKIYASHLPLFHAPHDYQAIFELKFSPEIKNQIKRDQQLHPEHTTYTIAPEKFILPDMIHTPRPFKVAVFRGHFERGGVKIVESTDTEIQQIIYVKRLDAKTERMADLQYIIFGNVREQFAVHLITQKPDFDQILQLSFDPGVLLNDFNKILIFPSNENTPPNVNGNVIQGIVNRDPVKVILLRQLYIEFDDLR